MATVHIKGCIIIKERRWWAIRARGGWLELELELAGAVKQWKQRRSSCCRLSSCHHERASIAGQSVVHRIVPFPSQAPLTQRSHETDLKRSTVSPSPWEPCFTRTTP
jgi:hypothetical protein